MTLLATVLMVVLTTYSYDMLNRMYLDVKFIRQQLTNQGRQP